MSGDTQPRKRKDKKRRKEDEGSPFQPTVPIITNNSTSNEDVNIHVHKEDRLGGGICAKLVFFVLLSALAVLIGLIITEHRGLTEVDNAEASANSKFSQIFEGWTDSSIDHQEHDTENILSEEHDGDEEHDVNASELEKEDDDEHEDSYEDDDDKDEDDDDKDEDENERSLDEDDTAENEDDEDEPDLTQEDLSDEVDKDVAEDDSNEMDDTRETEENDDNDDTQENYDTEEATEETYERSEEIDDKSVERGNDDDFENDEEENDKDEDDEYFKDDNDDDDDKYDDEKEDSAEENASDERDKLDKSDEEDKDFEQYYSEEKELDDDNDDQDDKDDDDDGGEERIIREATSREDRSKEERTVGGAKVKDAEDQVDDEKPEIVNAKREPDDDVQESSGMAVKVGVGVALLVVAHLVLCRKWRSDLSDEEVPSDQEDLEPRTVKERYTELRSTYSRTLGPQGESLNEPPNYEDDNDYDEEVEEEMSEEEDEEDDDLEDEDDEEDNDEEYDEEENEELLKRLDAKYGKLPGESSAGYAQKHVTNREDFKMRREIDDAENTIDNNPAYAVKLFDKILEKFPSSPRSLYGKALALNRLADQKRSNEILYRAIELYTKLLKTPDVPDALYTEAVEKAIKVMRFVGQYRNVIEIHKLAINRFPMNPNNYNDLAVTYLTINRIADARAILKEVLEKWPDDGFALVHQGFILKTADNKLEEAVQYLRKGIATNDPGVIDGRFYFHLGDALERLGKHDEAMKVYEEGTKNKVFLSKYQRSLYNVPRLTGKPFWEIHELPYLDLFRKLKQNWRKIREEGLSVLNEKGYFQDESENLRDKGVWKQFELFARGQKNTKNCAKTPITCDIIGSVTEAKGCKRGQTKFSVMHPGTHVWTHCGPTNCRLRVHLGLKVPPKTFLRVAQETRSWQEGEIIVFDDSFEHEVWHNGTEFRLVLIVDVWHPELTNIEKRNLSPI